MLFCVLLLVLLVALPVGFAWHTHQERQAWARYRLRLAPEALTPAFTRQLHGLLGQGGELWWLRDGATQALIIALPPARVADLHDLCARYAPGHALTPVRLQLGADFLPCWHLLVPLAEPTLRIERVAPVAMLILARGERGALLVAGDVCPTVPGWRPTRLPRLLLPTAGLRRRGLHLLRHVASWRVAPLPADAALLPPLAEVPGLALPALPATLPTTLRQVAGPALALGQALDGQPVTLPLAGLLEVTGDEAGRRAALGHVLAAALSASAGALVYVTTATADALHQAPALRDRVRAIDARRLATTATLDLAALFDDAQLPALWDELFQLSVLDEHGHMRQLLRAALAHWRTLLPPRQLGQLLTSLAQPTPALVRAAGLDDFAARFAAERWKRNLRPLLDRHLAGLLAAPGEDVRGIWAAGGVLLVVQPDQPERWSVLRAILRAVVAAQAPPTRPLVVIEERPQEELPFTSRDWPGATMTVWSQAAWSTEAAWRLATGGGVPPRQLPSHLRRHVHPLALLRPQPAWLVCEPDTDELALLLPPGVTPPTTAPGADARPTEQARTPVQDGPQAAAQTVLRTLRRVGQLIGGLGGVDLVLVQPAQHVALSLVEATTRVTYPVEVRFRQAVDGATLARRLADLGDDAVQAPDTTPAGTDAPVSVPQTRLLLQVSDPAPPPLAVPACTLPGYQGAAATLPWERLQAVLIHGAQAPVLAQHLVVATLRTMHADQLGLVLLGDLPAALQGCAVAPHGIPTTGEVPQSGAAPDQLLAAALLAVLEAQTRPDADPRPLLVVVALPETMQPSLMQALARLLRRAQSGRAFVLLVAPALEAAPLAVLSQALPLLTEQPPEAVLTLRGQPWWRGPRPTLLPPDMLTETLAALPPATPRPAPVPLPDDLADFWGVPPHELAPALPLPASLATPPDAVAAGESGADASADGATPIPWVLPGILDAGDLVVLVEALLADPGQRVGGPWVVTHLAERRTLSRAQGDTILTFLTTTVGVCSPAPGGGSQLTRGLDAATVWTMLEAAAGLPLRPPPEPLVEEAPEAPVVATPAAEEEVLP